ncbi:MULTISPECIES: TetR family transcriptional regulator [unclassified Coleofasciculus]|uniref:TetR family transcriptional regulator n=1 Tax=unclassified Coleofasciculus TaxID=2692782 RepID=UPI00187F01C8|nr:MULTISPECIES: TetR family transcriptional regulator [unclassified Coleofasciculus]MBE9125435.1 TetR family transcriptional regulator [Coleofasciculus sp. LEGE 07081]MBE9147121.1 TetR family transcriptional regulator [Coleofasciculus sp. LEGE 07092]
MSRTSSGTKARLIRAALELFSSQGVIETTTRQIAELAQVNEVTLFRHFGNKQGLLLAVIEDSAVFTRLGEVLREQVKQTSSVEQVLKTYASDRIQALEQIPELLRSVVGEAGQYTLENRQALGQGVTQANYDVAQYLATAIERDGLHLRLPAEKLASLLNLMLFGYLVIELTSEFHQLWDNREDFLENLVELVLHGAVSPEQMQVKPLENNHNTSPFESETVGDLSASVVHSILQGAKKRGLRDYALAYVLLGTGLLPEEIVALERSHQISNTNQHLLQIPQGAVRQVPVNQWIMGKRYGSYTRNPLTQWLKNRKDDQSALFVNDTGQRISQDDLIRVWQELTSGLTTPESQPLSIKQARQTWCVEMLIRGMSLEDLSILSGWDVEELQPYVRRAREKTALERAVRLDQKG